MNIVKRFIAWLTGRNNKEHCMNERTISTINELFAVINEYGDKGFYFRGENKDYGKTACLPAYLRNSKRVSLQEAGDYDNEWFKLKLEDLGVGFPYIPPADNNVGSSGNLVNFYANSYPLAFAKWSEEKLEALMKHYAPDFAALAKLTRKTDFEHMGFHFSSTYLDITSDIMVALHFACSEDCFISEDEYPKSIEPNKAGNGYLFVFNVKDIKDEKAEFLKWVYYPSYSYISQEKTTGKLYFQPFDRITHQRGAFLAPKKKKDGNKYIIDYEKLRKEIKKYTLAKITMTSALKKELYDVFGKERGLEYYFPKIPAYYSEIQQAYKKLKIIALLEKKE